MGSDTTATRSGWIVSNFCFVYIMDTFKIPRGFVSVGIRKFYFLHGSRELKSKPLTLAKQESTFTLQILFGYPHLYLRKALRAPISKMLIEMLTCHLNFNQLQTKRNIFPIFLSEHNKTFELESPVTLNPKYPVWLSSILSSRSI